MHVNACICKYLTALKQYIDLTGAVCVGIPNKYLQILTPCWGHRMHVYACICTHFSQHFWHKYVHIHTVTALSRLLCVHWRRRRSLHFHRAAASLSRSSASAGRSPNSIRSGLRDQSARSRRRQLGQARLGCAMAIMVTTEQRSPCDGAMIRYVC